MSRRKPMLLASLAALLAGGLGLTGATFVASSTNPGNTLSTNDDFHPPTVTLTSPGNNANVRGTISLIATTTDVGSGVASVKIQRSVHHTNENDDVWSDVCTDTTPDTGDSSSGTYSCSLDTTGLADGLYDFRAIATDNGSPNANSTTSTVVKSVRTDNTAPTVTMNDPGSPLHGSSVSLSATAADTGGSGVASVTIQRSPHNADPNDDTWTNVCTDNSSPYSCTLDSAALSDGLYDFRAVATDAAGNSTNSDIVASRRVDNTAPSATMDDPGSPLHGTVHLTGSGSDTGSGVASVQFQRKLTSGNNNSWVNVTGTGCSSTSSSGPYDCSFDTTSVADNLYDFRLVVTDAATNQTTSTAVTSRRIDNTAPTTSVTAPANGAFVRGSSVALTATASDGGSGLSNLKIQISAHNADSWTDVSGCSSATSPLNCTLTSTSLSDGDYDLRSVATDNATNSGTSTVVTVHVDNTAPTAQDIQTGNHSGGTAGRAETSDTVTFTYSEQIKASTIIASWNGTGTQNVWVKIADNGSDDIVRVYSDSATTSQVPLGQIDTNQNLVSADATFGKGSGGANTNSTISQSAATFTVTLGSLMSGTVVTNATAGAMSWTPSASATDLAGNPASTTPATESGGSDVDF